MMGGKGPLGWPLRSSMRGGRLKVMERGIILGYILVAKGADRLAQPLRTRGCFKGLCSMSGAESKPIFTVGDRVRVKAGVRTSKFPDVCMEGWTGEVIAAWPPNESSYVIVWSRETIAALPMVVRECFGVVWPCPLDAPMLILGEELELDNDDPEAHPFRSPLPPVPAGPHLSWNNQLDRIRAVFGLSSQEPLPSVSAGSLLVYRDYLKVMLQPDFRCKAEYKNERTRGYVSVWFCGIDDDFDLCDGLQCSLAGDHGNVEIPVSDLYYRENSVKSEIVHDYKYWFQNFRQ